MPCCSCVDKLAYRLMSNHKIDLIRAYEIAEKGIERHERAEAVTKEEMQALGFDPDYSLNCVAGGTCACRTLAESYTCVDPDNCAKNNACTKSCPDPSKPHSHYVSNTCAAQMDGSACVCSGTPEKCRGGTCVCIVTGLCYYVCDDGYTYNPVTGDCELIAVAVEPLMDGFVYVE